MPERNPPEPDKSATPEEEIEAAYQRLREGLVSELLETVKGCSPAFFEQLVVDLLVKMGYGGTRKDAGQAIGRSGDGGIDGIINEDRLGLDIVYIQAKKWDNTVSRPEIQKFAGALQGQRARRGVFITTSDFSSAAREYVSLIDSKKGDLAFLIDGGSSGGQNALESAAFRQGRLYHQALDSASRGGPRRRRIPCAPSGGITGIGLGPSASAIPSCPFPLSALYSSMVADHQHRYRTVA
jgi:hypothetical protein